MVSFKNFCSENVRLYEIGINQDINGKSHCVISLLIPFEEDVCTFLIFSYSFIDQQVFAHNVCLSEIA